MKVLAVFNIGEDGKTKLRFVKRGHQYLIHQYDVKTGGITDEAAFPHPRSAYAEFDSRIQDVLSQMGSPEKKEVSEFSIAVAESVSRLPPPYGQVGLGDEDWRVCLGLGQGSTEDNFREAEDVADRDFDVGNLFYSLEYQSALKSILSSLDPSSAPLQVALFLK